MQADNTVKDNKNQFVFAFFSDLVEKGLFQEIKFQFLMKGHTHEDIDQVIVLSVYTICIIMLYNRQYNTEL